MCFIGERRKSQGYDFQGNESQVIWCHSSPRHFLSVGSAESVLTTPWSLRGLWGQSEGRDQQELACTTEGCLPPGQQGPYDPSLSGSDILAAFRHIPETASHSLLANQLHPEKSLIQRSEHRRQVPLLCSVPTHTHTCTHTTHRCRQHIHVHTTHTTHVCVHTSADNTRAYDTHTTHMCTHKYTCPHTIHTTHVCAHATHHIHVHTIHMPHMCAHTNTRVHTCAHNTHTHNTRVHTIHTRADNRPHMCAYNTPHTCIQHTRVCAQV